LKDCNNEETSGVMILDVCIFAKIV